MTEKRFTTSGYYIYDNFKEDKWLVNEVEADLIVDKMNNLDLKARERSKALSKLQKENKKLKQEKPFLKIHNDYFIQYGDDRELFSMHKPSDIRSLMYLINRENGYSELQCEYNDLEMVEDG